MFKIRYCYLSPTFRPCSNCNCYVYSLHAYTHTARHSRRRVAVWLRRNVNHQCWHVFTLVLVARSPPATRWAAHTWQQQYLSVAVVSVMGAGACVLSRGALYCSGVFVKHDNYTRSCPCLDLNRIYHPLFTILFQNLDIRNCSVFSVSRWRHHARICILILLVHKRVIKFKFELAVTRTNRFAMLEMVKVLFYVFFFRAP